MKRCVAAFFIFVFPSCFVFGSHLSNLIHYIIFANLFESCIFTLFWSFFKEDTDTSSPIVQCRTQQVYLLVCMLIEIVEVYTSSKWPEQFFQSHTPFSKFGTHHQERGPLFPLSLNLGWTLWLFQWIECSENHAPGCLWYGFHMAYPLSFFRSVFTSLDPPASMLLLPCWNRPR